VIGRGTFETVLGFPFWPYDKPVFVLSKTLKDVPDNLREKATISSLEPSELLRHLSDEGFKAAYVDGGKVIQSFLAADLIDSLIHCDECLLLFGGGIPLFGSLDKDINFETSADKHIFKRLGQEVITNGSELIDQAHFFTISI
jgi:dihydrofolate reductase